MKFRGILLFVAGLVIGGLVIPVAAQSDPAENQLAIRSDGFIFLLRSGQRHLVLPVALTDEVINGYPEGEPFLSARSRGSRERSARRDVRGNDVRGQQFHTGVSSGSSTPSRTATATVSTAATATPKPDSSEPISPRFKTIPSTVEQNQTFKVVIEATDGSTCDGKIQFKGGKTAAFTSGKTSKSECKMEVVIPDDARLGDADVKATVKSGGQSVDFEDVTQVFAPGKSPG